MQEPTNVKLRKKWGYEWLEEPETIWGLEDTEFEEAEEFKIVSIPFTILPRILVIGKDSENLVVFTSNLCYTALVF